MYNLEPISVEIAEILLKCIENKTVICYSDIYKDLEHISRNNIGEKLEALSLFTNDKYGVFISSLVVHKETMDNEIPLSGDGFFEMYKRIRGHSDKSQKELEQAEREKSIQPIGAIFWTRLDRR